MARPPRPNIVTGITPPVTPTASPTPSTAQTKTEEKKTMTTTAAAGGFWDDPEVKPAASSFMKFETVGDTISGVITKLTKRTFGAGTAEERISPEVHFAPENGEDLPTMTAGQVLLQDALWTLRPSVGDRLGVTLTRIEKRGTKTLKRFKVELTRADGSTELVDQTQG